MTAPERDDHFPVGPEKAPDRFASRAGGPTPPDSARAPAAPPLAERELAEPNGFRPGERSGLAVPGFAASDEGEPGAPLAEADQAGEAPASAVAGDGDAAAPAVASGEPGRGARVDASSGGESGEAEALVALGRPAPGTADPWPPDEVLEAVELDDAGWTRRSLEAILLVADEPVPAATLAELVGARLTQVEALLVDLAGEYAGQGRGFVLRAVAGGWRLYTHPATREVVEAYLRAGQQSRLTRAALETLAVIAYRQPVTRLQVAAVRGVNVDGVFRTLAGRGLIQEVGHEEGPGQATLYGTTPAFLEQLGLNGLDQLPPIKDYLPEGADLMELLEQM